MKSEKLMRTFFNLCIISLLTTSCVHTTKNYYTIAPPKHGTPITNSTKISTSNEKHVAKTQKPAPPPEWDVFAYREYQEKYGEIPEWDVLNEKSPNKLDDILEPPLK